MFLNLLTSTQLIKFTLFVPLLKPSHNFYYELLFPTTQLSFSYISVGTITVNKFYFILHFSIQCEYYHVICTYL